MADGIKVTRRAARGPSYKFWRCDADGEWLIEGPNARIERCHIHPDAPLHDFSTQTANYRAQKYIEVQARSGESLGDMVERFDADRWPGTSQGEMALVLVLMQRWGVVPEREEPMTPAGLFG